MSYERFITIDPGLDGAIALWVPSRCVLQIEDVPTFALKKGKKAKRYIDYASVARILDDWCGSPDHTIGVIELVGSMPGQGIASAFDFGRTYGALKMGLSAQFIRVEDVTPPVWKRGVGLPTGAEKDQSRAAACNIFPRHTRLFARAKDHNRADAALIAHYGSQKWGTQ